jgi:CARDB
LSFFDEVDEPAPPPRTTQRRRRPSGGGRRPPSDQQAILIRRAVAAAAILIVIILIVIGVHSCQISQRNSALKDYNNNVASLIQQSDQTSSQLFNELSHGGGSSNANNLQNQLNETRVTADNQLTKVKSLSVPDEMRAAQDKVILAFQMRRDGIEQIATRIQEALGTSTNRDAINSIAAQMARFYASDVVYKDYAIPLIVGALKSASIGVGGSNGETIESGQFLPDLQWLQPTFVSSKIGARAPTTTGKPAPGLHGHSLDSVSVGGNTLSTGSTNTIAANPPPTFTFHLTNGGQNNETNVTLKITISGSSITGQTVVPQTQAGQSATGQVTLSSSPPAGSYTVKATVDPVPGEKNTSNNTLSFPVTFQ